MAPARMHADLDAAVAGAAVDVSPVEALLLRASAIGHSSPLSDVAPAVLDRRLLPASGGEWTWTAGRGAA